MRHVVGLAAILMAAQASAQWKYEEIKDDFDGTSSYLLQVDSSVAVTGTDGRQHYPFLQIRCDEDGGQPYVRIHWFAIIDTSLMNTINMQVRIDGKADNRLVWQMNRDDTLMGLTTYRVPPVVKALSGASELKLRIAGHIGKTHDATFDVSGLHAALKQLQPHCKRL